MPRPWGASINSIKPFVSADIYMHHTYRHSLHLNKHGLVHIPAGIEGSSSKASLFTSTDGALGLHLANLSRRCGTGGTATDCTNRTADCGTDDDTGGAGDGRAALPLLLHPLIGWVGLGHGLLLVHLVGVINDQGIIIGGRNERGGGVHLVLEAAVALDAAGSEEDEARVDDCITRAVGGGRGWHDCKV